MSTSIISASAFASNIGEPGVEGAGRGEREGGLNGVEGVGMEGIGTEGANVDACACFACCMALYCFKQLEVGWF
jgi:hypothetical protein